MSARAPQPGTACGGRSSAASAPSLRRTPASRWSRRWAMPEAAPTTSEHDVLTFLTALYGQAAPGFLTFWQRQDRRTLWVAARDLEQSAHLVVSSAETMDVYVGMGLR